MHKLAKPRIGKRATGKDGAEKVKEVSDWSQGELVGRDCRMVDEAVHATFGAPAKVRGQKGSQVRLEVDGHFHSVLCTVAQVDLLPELVPSAAKCKLILTKGENIELH